MQHQIPNPRTVNATTDSTFMATAHNDTAKQRLGHRQSNKRVIEIFNFCALIPRNIAGPNQPNNFPTCEAEFVSIKLFTSERSALHCWS